MRKFAKTGAGIVAVSALVASASSEARADHHEEAPYDFARGQLFVASKTAVFDITRGNRDFSDVDPFYDAEAHGFDGVEGICFGRGGGLVSRMFISNNRKVVVGNKSEFHGEVARITITAGVFVTEIWATGFGTVSGLECTDDHVYMAEFSAGKVWDVTLPGDYTERLPIVDGLLQPFDVIRIPLVVAAPPLFPWFRPAYLLSSGRTKLYGIYDYRSESPTVVEYGDLGLFLSGLAKYDDRGPSPYPALAISDQSERQIHNLKGRRYPVDGPWNTLATIPGPPSALIGVGNKLYTSDFENNAVWVVNERSGKVELYAWGFPQFDIAEFTYVHGCGDGVLDFDLEFCDDAGESATCNGDCTPTLCGDGIVNETAGEECDDFNFEDGDGCSADCRRVAVADADPVATESNSCAVASAPRSGSPSPWSAAALAAFVGFASCRRRSRVKG